MRLRCSQMACHSTRARTAYGITDAVPPKYIHAPENRGVRKSLAGQTFGILNDGFYEANAGRIEIAELQAQAEAGTRVYAPANFAELRPPQSAHDSKIRVTAETTLDAGYQLYAEGHDRVLCLNFAFGPQSRRGIPRW
jgi:hypothetical protein